jgi:hypothetical protein
MPKRRALAARLRGCPCRCSDGDALQQREVTHEELSQLEFGAVSAVRKSGWPCYICNSCGCVYVREPYLDVALGRLSGWLK